MTPPRMTHGPFLEVVVGTERRHIRTVLDSTSDQAVRNGIDSLTDLPAAVRTKLWGAYTAHQRQAYLQGTTRDRTKPTTVTIRDSPLGPLGLVVHPSETRVRRERSTLAAIANLLNG